jgi:phosphatidylinositol-3-phosphatase
MRRVTVLIAAAITLAGCAGTATGRQSALSSDPPPPVITAPPGAVGSSAASPPPLSAPAPIRPAHVVVVVLENRSFADVIANPSAPFINSLADSGALFTESFAVGHPSEPNYLALFSGSTQGVSDDSCPHTFSRPNLAAALESSGGTFVGYSEDLPAVGFTGCTRGGYARKHAPWVDFRGVASASSRPFTAFAGDYANLPTLAFVIPNLDHDMHDGTIAQGDQWLQRNVGTYARWAGAHNSLLIVTWDEDDRSENNQIPTIIAGAHVRVGRYREHLTHYRLLRTLAAMFALTPIGASVNTEPVTDIWQR